MKTIPHTPGECRRYRERSGMRRVDPSTSDGAKPDNGVPCAVELAELFTRSVVRWVRGGFDYGEALDSIAEAHGIDRRRVDWMLGVYCGGVTGPTLGAEERAEVARCDSPTH